MATVKEPNGETISLEAIGLIRDILTSIARSNRPWWHSGSACLAALFWAVFAILGLALAFGRAEPTIPFGFVAAFFFLIAFFAAILANQEGKND